MKHFLKIKVGIRQYPQESSPKCVLSVHTIKARLLLPQTRDSNVNLGLYTAEYTDRILMSATKIAGNVFHTHRNCEQETMELFSHGLR